MGFIANVYCDKCGARYTNSSYYLKKDVVRHMRRQGWTMGKYDICPDCKKSRGKP
jgi:NAD-dependent SIR2 family protein deacetylase